MSGIQGKWHREAAWCRPDESSPGGRVKCELCPHGCVLGEGERGLCGVRAVESGKLHTLVYGRPCAVHVDPVEKKPFYHFLPASAAFSIATVGCNLRCLNCQNWEISQAAPEAASCIDLPPEEVVNQAQAAGCSSIAYTYTEPLVYYEYTYETAVLARERGIRNLLVTAGYINPEPLRRLCSVVDAANVDLKGFDDLVYRKLNSVRLAPVLKALEIMKEEGLWIEVSNLIVPTFTDDLARIRKLCRWIAEHLGSGTPLHFLRFHPAHKLASLPPTPVEIMLNAADVAREEGLHFVYVGNVREDRYRNTICPACGSPVVERDGFSPISINLQRDGVCQCGYRIPGVWTRDP